MTTTPWKHVAGLEYEKELLPLGKVVKWIDDSREPISVDVHREFLDRTVEQFKKFQQVGIRVPLFKTHVEDPDNDRGTVRDVMVKQNDDDVDSLFIRVKFNDEKARDQGLHNDVSAMCPARFVDAKGNHYEYPLRHVALTSMPVVPGLKSWEPVVMSFDTPSGLLLADEPPTGAKAMNAEMWAKLLALLDIPADDGSTPDQQLEKVIAAVTALKGGGEQKPPEGAGGAAFSYPPMFTEQMRKSREQRLEALVASHDLTPALADEFKKKYCTIEAVSADLKLSADTGADSSEFDRTLELATKIAKDRPLQPTGRRTVKLSHSETEDGESSNPLIRNMQKRAKQAQR